LIADGVRSLFGDAREIENKGSRFVMKDLLPLNALAEIYNSRVGRIGAERIAQPLVLWNFGGVDADGPAAAICMSGSAVAAACCGRFPALPQRPPSPNALQSPPQPLPSTQAT